MPDVDPPANPDPQGDPVDPPVDTPEDDPAPPPELGDPGKQALDRMKAERNTARQRAKELEEELEALKTAQLPDHEKALKEAVDAARAETLQKVNSRLFTAELKALSVNKIADPDLLSDPEVALRLLGLSEIPVTDDGDIDTEAISGALSSLLEAKPYLASAEPAPGDPAPIDLGQGARGTPAQVELDPKKLASRVKSGW